MASLRARSARTNFATIGLKPVIAQANVASNRKKGTLRGMHFQYPPAAETKLVRCTRGGHPRHHRRPAAGEPDLSPARRRRAQRRQHAGALRAGALRPRLPGARDNTDASYQVGEFYTPSAEGGLRHDDARLGLQWPLPVTVISAKDRNFRRLNEIEGELAAPDSTLKEPVAG